MDKGLFIMVIVGSVFIYFAVNMFNTSSSKDDSQWASNSSKNPYAKYYKKDVIGDMVLDLNSLDIAKAKPIWAAQPIVNKLIDEVPDFDHIKADVKNSLDDGKFKTYVLQYIDKLQDKYTIGEIDSDQIKKLLKTLQ